MLFRELAEYYDKLESTSSRLKMMDLLTEMFKLSKPSEVSNIVYMTQGILAPSFEGVEFGLAEKMAEEAIASATGHTKAQVEAEFRKTGDLGVAAEHLKEQDRTRKIVEIEHDVSGVFATMKKIAGTGGQGSQSMKIKMLSGLISASTPLEARYLVRYPLGQLRLGVGDATILESLSLMKTGTREHKAALEKAYNLCSDLGLVAEELTSKGLAAVEHFKVSVFKPIRPALAERLPTGEEILKRMHGHAAVEQKYDGFRMQVHKSGKKVRLFSRRLEDTTEMFPDMVRAVLEEVKADTIIFEGEAIAYNEATGEYLPFQETIQRKRKHDIEKKAEELPLHLMVFDIMFLDGKECISMPYRERREKIESLFGKSRLIIPTVRIVTDSPKELEEFFEKSVENGLEGVMSKDLDAPYVAGARKFSWIKLKRSYKGELSDTLDLVIVGYFLGKGSRAEFKFGGLLCATYNQAKDVFETISRIGTGFSEKQMVELKETLDKVRSKSKPARVDAVVEPDFWVYPKYVVTIRADEITRSPTHTCGRSKSEDGTETGYALRFPRLVGPDAIRADKSVDEATTTQEVIEMFKQQKKVSVGTGEK